MCYFNRFWKQGSKSQLARAIWRDEVGFIVTTEILVLATLILIGLVVGHAAMRDALNSELNDIATALTSLDQSAEIEDCDDPSDPIDERFEAEGPNVSATSGSAIAEGWNLDTNGEVFFEFDIEAEGTYTFSSRLWGQGFFFQNPNAAFVVDGNTIGNFSVSETSFDTAGIYSVDVNLTPGSRQFSVEFTNDFIFRELNVDWLNLQGPN